jgi:colanic acid biosynthesis glycosyl transferase WcaI
LVRPLPRNNAFREQYGFTDEQTVCLYSGNMGEKQGMDLIIQAADRLRNVQNIQFVMAGDGAAKSRLEELSEQANLDNLRFVPLQPVEQLPEFLAFADVHFVIQKRQVADLVMPSKLTNILAAGRPTLATAAEGTSLYQLLTSEDAGLVTSPEDLAAFVNAILALHQSPALRERLGHHARKYAEKFLDKESILSGFETTLKDLVGRQL